MNMEKMLYILKAKLNFELKCCQGTWFSSDVEVMIFRNIM